MHKLRPSPLAPATPSTLLLVPGVRLATAATGIRYRGRDDLLLMELPEGSTVAGLLTSSATPGHPVVWCRQQLIHGRARALVVNAGNANVFNGSDGDDAVRDEADAAASALGCKPNEVFVASTGVIGQRLNVAKIIEALPALGQALAEDRWAAASQAIMTTDTFAKGASRTAEIDGVTVTLTGIAKGSGMIQPDFATMLAFIATDADLDAHILQRLLSKAATVSFACTTVDGDTSTSDTVLLFASRKALHAPVDDSIDPRLGPFAQALLELCVELAQLIVRDGEGAEKLITVNVAGAVDEQSARQVAMTIANSPLVKTAIAGSDANWGRVVMAIGRAGVDLVPDRLCIRFGGISVAEQGAGIAGYDESAVTRHLAGRDVQLDVDLGMGSGSATVWTCDLTHAYIDINADYRS